MDAAQPGWPMRYPVPPPWQSSSDGRYLRNDARFRIREGRSIVRSQAGRMVIAAVLGIALAMVMSVAASAEVRDFTVTPTRVVVGGTVTLSGTALSQSPENPAHASACTGPVTLSSGAFAGHGNGSIQLPFGGLNSGFRTQVTILSQVRPGTYTIEAQCQGTIDPPARATLVVTSPGFPATGALPVPTPKPWDGVRVTAVVTGLLAILLVAAVLIGRVRPLRPR